MAAQSRIVTVDQGYLSKNLAPGATAHILAQQNTSTRIFAGWAGDSQYLLDPAAPYTTFIVPDANVSLRATYRTVPAWTPLTATLNNIPVTYYIPPNPVGLVFSFHGTGGTGASQFTGAEFLAFFRELVPAGFGVAAFDSLDRAAAQWNTTITGPTNPDIARLNGIIAAMRAQSLISSQLPLFAFGQSNGGFFSHFSSIEMKWTAVSISCVPGSTAAANAYTGPMAWLIAKNDDHPQVGPVGNANSLIDYELHVNRGVHGRHTSIGPMPLFPERFTRSQILTLADSLELYNIFKSNNWIDANDFLVRNPSDINWRAALPAHFTAAMILSIDAQLQGTYSAHEFSNYTPHIMIDLFLRALGRLPALRPVSGASFGGSSVAPSSIGAIFIGGLASGLEVASTGPQANLRNVKAVFRSGAGAELPVPWFFVSPSQGSFLVPAGVPAGNAILKIESGDRRWGFPSNIAATSPGIFTANGNGQGVPAAVILRVAPDNSRSTECPFAAGQAGFDAAPIRFGDDRLFRDLYATGVRGASSVQVLLGSESITPLFAGAQPEFVGLDQVTIELPRSFAGRGKADVVIVSGGVRSNTVELNFGN